MTIAISQPTPREQQALIEFFAGPGGREIRQFIEKNAAAYLQRSMDPSNDAISRQAQGAWMALTSLLNTANPQ